MLSNRYAGAFPVRRARVCDGAQGCCELGADSRQLEVVRGGRRNARRVSVCTEGFQRVLRVFSVIVGRESASISAQAALPEPTIHTQNRRLTSRPETTNDTAAVVNRTGHSNPPMRVCLFAHLCATSLLCCNGCRSEVERTHPDSRDRRTLRTCDQLTPAQIALLTNRCPPVDRSNLKQPGAQEFVTLMRAIIHLRTGSDHVRLGMNARPASPRRYKDAALSLTMQADAFPSPKNGRAERELLRPPQDCAVGNRQPAIRRRSPSQPRRGNLLELGDAGHARLDQLMRQVGLKDAVGPHRAPPFPGFIRRIAPYAAGGCDVVEAGRTRPGQQPPGRVRFAAVGAGRSAIEIQPAIESRKLREPSCILGLLSCYMRSI
jgi:hypothetical protein